MNYECQVYELDGRMKGARRLSATVRWDVVRQFRSGFYYASGFFVLVWAAVFVPLPAGTLDLGLMLPALMLVNLSVVAFYYVGALVLLEKSEGSLLGIVVSPLRGHEYLLGKVISLTGLAVLESGVLVVLIYGVGFRPLFLLSGMVLLSGFYVLVGFMVIVRYGSINEFLLPSIVLVTGLIAPAVDYFGLWQSPFFYLHPVQPALLLMRGAFVPLELWQMVYGFVGAAVWVVVAFVGARWRFQRMVVGR